LADHHDGSPEGHQHGDHGADHELRAMPSTHALTVPFAAVRQIGRANRAALVVTALALVTAGCRATSDGGAAIGRIPGLGVSTTLALPAARVADPGAVITPRGVVLPVVARLAGGGWTVHTPCGTTATLSKGTPVTSAMVVLDPGHGGSDPGATSPDNLPESRVNLEVARDAQAALQAAGVSALLTRTGDYDLDLGPRAEIARDLQPLAFVSIHHNAEPDGPRAGPGTETYYQIASPDSKRLAGLIYEEVVKALSQYHVAWVADTDAGAKYRPGDHGDYYAMLRLPGRVVSVLAELAYVSNQAEADLLARPDVQKVEGDAVARGILRYLTTDDPGSGFTIPYPRVDPPPDPNAPPAPPCRDPQL
jgi:N-acetylmuramoyl-L-alanine amidase